MFVFEVKNKQALALLRDAKNRVRTLKVFAAKNMRDIIEREIKLNFLREGQPAAGRAKWRELAERTQRDRASKGYPPKKPILIRSGTLYRTATRPRIRVSSTSIHVSPNTSSSKKLMIMSALQEGVPKRRIGPHGTVISGSYEGRLPPRPFFFLTKRAWAEIVRMLAEFLKGRRRTI